MYIGHEGLESNKPPMPLYGDVWRQTVSPPLWIAGLHDVSKLTVRDLQPVPEQDLPILAPDHVRVDISDDVDDDDFEIEPVVYDSDDDSDDYFELQLYFISTKSLMFSNSFIHVYLCDGEYINDDLVLRCYLEILERFERLNDEKYQKL